VLDGNDLTLPIPDDHAHIGEKTIACFEYVLAQRDFGVIFRTNTSSYVDLANLRAFVAASATETRCYRGVIGTGPFPFASGSGYLLSRDLVELVVEHRSSWNHRLPDDAAPAAVLAELGVVPTPAPRQDLERARDVAGADLSHFHFRCRTESWRRLENARIMLALHRRFCFAQGMPVPKQLRARVVERLALRPIAAGYGVLRRFHIRLVQARLHAPRSRRL
jgi:hypothetical protein